MVGYFSDTFSKWTRGPSSQVMRCLFLHQSDQGVGQGGTQGVDQGVDQGDQGAIKE